MVDGGCRAREEPCVCERETETLSERLCTCPVESDLSEFIFDKCMRESQGDFVLYYWSFALYWFQVNARQNGKSNCNCTCRIFWQILVFLFMLHTVCTRMRYFRTYAPVLSGSHTHALALTLAHEGAHLRACMSVIP